MSGGGSDGEAFVDGSPVYMWKNWVAPHYFETVGMPLLAGRDFQHAPAAAHAAIVNQTFAQKAMGGTSPLGHHIRFKSDPNSYEIVGVVGDAKYVEIREKTQPTVYLDTFDKARPDSTFVIRTASGPAAIRSETRDLLKTVVITKISTLAEHIDGSIVQERLVAMLSGVFGALGLMLAAIGLYGLLAYTVARRTKEIGIRIALGAHGGGVIAMVLREAGLLVVLGVAIGVPISLAAAKVAAASVAGLPRADLVTVVGSAVVLIAAGAASAFVPARRAARVEPMVALRWE
jgi:ABC-type antimicrobial peptide transport system permease subunit